MAREQVLVALLRGVNVGGKTVIKMAHVRDVAASCGFEHVRTYVQSGNVVFTTTKKVADATAALRRALTDATGHDIGVAMRTSSEMAKVVDNCPFDDVAHVHVAFLVDGAQKSPPKVAPDQFAPERFEVRGRETYLYLPDGIGRSKLAAALAKGGDGRSGTVRNWRTVTALAEMASEPPM